MPQNAKREGFLLFSTFSVLRFQNKSFTLFFFPSPLLGEINAPVSNTEGTLMDPTPGSYFTPGLITSACCSSCVSRKRRLKRRCGAWRQLPPCVSLLAPIKIQLHVYGRSDSTALFTRHCDRSVSEGGEAVSTTRRKIFRVTKHFSGGG